MTHTKHVLAATPPKRWASTPKWLTLSFVVDVEQCPRRASLRRSDYGELWKGHGYPPAFNAAAARGTIIHACIGRIGTELANEGCKSVNDSVAFTVLKRLGGYSVVLREEIQSWVLQSEENPRLRQDSGAILQYLERLLPEMRMILQSILRSTEFQPKNGLKPIPPLNSGGRLYRGTYFEVELKHAGVKWKGLADSIEITDTDEVAITDFKTGAPKDRDQDQVRLYALLWAHDKLRNPKGRLATKLLLQYSGAQASVTVPNREKLVYLETLLQGKNTSIRDQFEAMPPVAKVSSATCLHCDVRHLCSDYWIKAANIIEVRDSRTFDCEVLLQDRIGYSSWRASVLHTSAAVSHSQFAVHFSEPSLADSMGAGDRLRLMQIAVEPTDSGLPIVTVRQSTELFRSPVS